jgi:hypothetical protein
MGRWRDAGVRRPECRKYNIFPVCNKAKLFANADGMSAPTVLQSIAGAMYIGATVVIAIFFVSRNRRVTVQIP